MQISILPDGKVLYQSWRPTWEALLNSGRAKVGDGTVVGVVPLGTILTDFLALYTNFYDTFAYFVSRFGLDPFGKYLTSSAEYGTWYADKANRDSRRMSNREFDALRDSLYQRNKQYLEDEVKPLLGSFVDRWLSLKPTEDWQEGLSPAGRFCYRPDSRLFDMLRGLQSGLNPVVVKETQPIDVFDSNQIPKLSLDDYKNLLSDHTAYLAETYTTDDIVTVCAFEIAEMLKQRRTLNLCISCRKYFVPERVDENYCRRPRHTLHHAWAEKGPSGHSGLEQLDPLEIPLDRLFRVTCQTLGPRGTYKQSLVEGSVKLAYRRAYKRLHGKIATGDLTKDQFEAWRDEARRKMRAVENNKLAPEEFITWSRP